MADKKLAGKARDYQVVLLSDLDGNPIDPAQNSAAPIGTSNVTYYKTSAAGTIAAGAFSVSVINSGDVDGTIDGTALTPDEFPPAFEAAPGTRLGAITFDATGTEFTFAVVS